MIKTHRKYTKVTERRDQRAFFYLTFLFLLIFSLAAPSPAAYAQRKETKGQKKNAVSTTPSDKKTKSNGGKKVVKGARGSKSAKKSQGSPVKGADGEKNINKKGETNVKNNVKTADRASKRAKKTQRSPIGDKDAVKSQKNDYLNNKNTVKTADRASKRAKKTQGSPIGDKDAIKSQNNDYLENKNTVLEGKRDAQKAKVHQKNPIEWKLPVVRKKSPESTSITPKVPVIDHRKKNLEMKRKEGKLMTSRMPKREEGLPKKNPIEYRVPSSREKEKRTREIAKYTGGMKMPYRTHEGRMARKKSRMILNYSGKLNIAKPANDRKSYYKLSRKTSTYTGDLKVTWLHYHHRHPSLWRMGRKRDKASSAEVWRNRKMPKRSKYDPGERKIWQNPNSSTTH